jgi:hypothetical protein
MAAPTEIQRSLAQRDAWSLGYQQRQFGVNGHGDTCPTIVGGLAAPSTAMVTAEAVVDSNVEEG